MNLGIEKKENPFVEWINSVSVGEYPQIRRQIIKRCLITRQVFSHWKNGNTNVPPLAQTIINEIAEEHHFTKIFEL